MKKEEIYVIRCDTHKPGTTYVWVAIQEVHYEDSFLRGVFKSCDDAVAKLQSVREEDNSPSSWTVSEEPIQ